MLFFMLQSYDIVFIVSVAFPYVVRGKPLQGVSFGVLPFGLRVVSPVPVRYPNVGAVTLATPVPHSWFLACGR